MDCLGCETMTGETLRSVEYAVTLRCWLADTVWPLSGMASKSRSMRACWNDFIRVSGNLTLCHGTNGPVHGFVFAWIFPFLRDQFL